MKIKILALQARNMYEYKAEYDPDEGLAVVSKIMFEGTMKSRLKIKERRQKFSIQPKHMFMKIGRGGRVNKTPHVIVDLDLRSSISFNPSSENPGISIEDIQSLKSQIDYVSERSFWDALMTKSKLNRGEVLVYLLAGGGMVYIARILFISMGIYIP